MVYLFLADGFEELEAVAVIDILRRAEIGLKTAGVAGNPVTSARGVSITADMDIDSLPQAAPDMLILPGGLRGVENLSKSDIVCDMLKDAFAKDIPVAAICAAPMLLAGLGLLRGRRVTCYPSVADKVKAGGGKVKKTALCYCDGHLITGAGPGSAIAFGLHIVSFLKNKKIARKISKDMLVEQAQDESAAIVPMFYG